MIKEMIKGCGIILGSALVINVGKELIKEYDSIMEENNRLKEFIDNHDFYEREIQSELKTDIVGIQSVDFRNCQYY